MPCMLDFHLALFFAGLSGTTFFNRKDFPDSRCSTGPGIWVRNCCAFTCPSLLFQVTVKSPLGEAATSAQYPSRVVFTWNSVLVAVPVRSKRLAMTSSSVQTTMKASSLAATAGYSDLSLLIVMSDVTGVPSPWNTRP